jgi:hypothetical protein
MSWAQANQLRVLQARAEARALLVRLEKLELEQAIDALWRDALDHGIDEQIAAAVIFSAFEGMIAPA